MGCEYCTEPISLLVLTAPIVHTQSSVLRMKRTLSVLQSPRRTFCYSIVTAMAYRRDRTVSHGSSTTERLYYRIGCTLSWQRGSPLGIISQSTNDPNELWKQSLQSRAGVWPKCFVSIQLEHNPHSYDKFRVCAHWRQ